MVRFPQPSTQRNRTSVLLPLIGRRHVVIEASDAGESVNMVRLNIHPDGGVSRLRIFGKRA
ncbi:MAG: hypothetical protein HQ513_05305 [Rhodospirillales bacterium]|nr:hypothetical protein [Rhodospirillales bacterium]